MEELRGICQRFEQRLGDDATVFHEELARLEALAGGGVAEQDVVEVVVEEDVAEAPEGDEEDTDNDES